MRTSMWIAAVAAVLAATVDAAPWVPEVDTLVLETIAEKRDPALAGLARLRSAARAEPNDVAAATRFARRAIEAARATGDPRFLGQARSALAPWWSTADTPLVALLLRATVKQSLHDFDGALSDLDRLIERSPQDAQARLTRATVRTVLGRYADASDDCNALDRAVAALVVAACRADVASRIGRSHEALTMLTTTLDASRDDAGLRAWAATMAGEIAARRGEHERAEQLFRRSLALDPTDAYTLGEYADLLLDRGRPRDVVALVAERTRHDALLLRLTLALRELPDRSAYEARRAELAARIEAARLRGDSLHRREAARFTLAIERDPDAAFKLAHANWAVQREPADLRVFAEAARATGNRAALREVSAWMHASGLEDVTIAALLNGGAR